MDQLNEGIVDKLAKSKVEQDVERHLLGTTVKLSDGTNGLVFTRGPKKNESQMFLYNCNLCGVPNLPGERCLQTHIAGRKHQTKLGMPIIDADQFRQSLNNKSKLHMDIAPGEPVPPGFENEVKPVAELQADIDMYKEQPLVGLEYIMELILNNETEASYHCVLCDKRGDPRTIIAHITSYNHRLKFLEKHYPSVVRDLAPYRYNRDAKNVLHRIMQAVCEAIEDHHGRLTINVHDYNEYNKNKIKYLQDVINDKHLDEKNGPNFLNVIDLKAIAEELRKVPSVSSKRDPSPPNVTKPSKKTRIDLSSKEKYDRKGLDSISSISSSSLSRSRSRSPRVFVRRPNNRERFQRAKVTVSRSRSSSREYHRSISPGNNGSRKFENADFKRRQFYRREFSGSQDNRQSVKYHHHISPERKFLPTPKELEMQASEIAKEGYKWEKYRCMVETAVGDLEKTLKEHEKNPEKHPLYPEEWKKFWNRRYKELQAEKKDPSKHDFKPEWIEFWTKRLKDLHDEEIEAKKIEIRNKLGMTDECEEKTDALRQQYRMKISKGEEKISSAHIIIDDDDDDDSNSHYSSFSRRREKDRYIRQSQSPFSLDHIRRSPSKQSYKKDYLSDYFKEKDLYFRDRESNREHYMHRKYSDRNYTDNYDDWASRYYSQDRHMYIRNVETYEPVEEVDDGPLTVVSVLRLLTALEDLLGSLGPKIIDLLAKALALEKVKANSSDEMLLNEDNSVLFETVKEKLKGQLIAGMLERQKIKTVKKAIKNIASIIHQVNNNPKEIVKQEISTVMKTKSNILNMFTPSGSLDKPSIAKNIATSLFAQGKTDITTEQLEQLINVFIGMLKMSKETNKPITTLNYISKIEKEQMFNNDIIKEPPTFKHEKKLESLDVIKDETLSQESNALENFTDSDLQTLLQNFKDLSTEEQHHLISYLKKLESTDPERVEKLRKYVSLEHPKTVKPDISTVTRNTSPFSNREEIKNQDKNKFDFIPTLQQIPDYLKDEIIEETQQNKRLIDSDDDDDYTFDDVVKAASRNITDQNQDRLKNQQETIKHDGNNVSPNLKTNSFITGSSKTINTSLIDTTSLIANLMGSLQKNVANLKAANNLSLPGIDLTTIYEAVKTSNSIINDNASNKNLDTNNSNTLTKITNLPYYQQQQANDSFNNTPSHNAFDSTNNQYYNFCNNSLQNSDNNQNDTQNDQYYQQNYQQLNHNYNYQESQINYHQGQQQPPSHPNKFNIGNNTQYDNYY